MSIEFPHVELSSFVFLTVYFTSLIDKATIYIIVTEGAAASWGLLGMNVDLRWVNSNPQPSV